MSAIKNAYVCAVDGVPELFATEDQALELAAEASSAWYDAGADLMNVPRIAVMSANDWLQAQDRLAQAVC